MSCDKPLPLQPRLKAKTSRPPDAGAIH